MAPSNLRNQFRPSLTEANLLKIVFVLLLASYLVYGAAYIWRTSFVLAGQRTFALFDDAMISMRYARNLAEGHGLVWNPGGERVEGYSNPLWVLYMAVIHLFPAPTHLISLIIQLSGLLFLFLNLFVIAKIARHVNDSPLVPLLVVFLTAFYFPLNTWALQGMEVSALTLLLSLAVWKTLLATKGGFFSRWPYLLLGIGTLLRIDIAVPYLLIFGFLVWRQPRFRKQHLLWGLGLLAFFLGGQTLFRLWYYGELLPNTYYLKLGCLPLVRRLAQGLSIALRFIWESGWFLMLLPALLLLLWPSSDIFLLFLVFAGQLGYSIYVGGDSWDHQGGANRFISIAMPLFFLLFVHTLDKLRRRFIILSKHGGKELLSQGLVATLVFASLFSFNTLRVQNSAAKLLLREDPLFVEGTQRYVGLALTLQEITTPSASIAVVAAGNIPYFTERFYIDLLGKNDRYIAHLPPVTEQGYHDFYDFQPGHVKWDLGYSITELKPDVIAQLPVDVSEAQPYLQDYVKATIDGIIYYLRINSPNILWHQVPH